MDRILIEGLRLQACVGVTAEERGRPQPIEVELELWKDLKAAGRLDRMEETVDYAAAAREAKAFVEGGSFRLVERIAEGLAELLLERFGVQEARVRVRKFSLPGARSVGVEINRDLETRSGAASSSRSHGKSRTRSRSPKAAPQSRETALSGRDRR